MVDYTTSLLTDLSDADYTALAQYMTAQTSETVAQRVLYLDNWKSKSGRVWLAKDGSTIVGSYFVVPATSIDYIKNHTALNTYLSNNSISISSCVISLDIYVDSSYSGQGIYTQLKANRGQYNIDEGYTYSLGYGYGSDAIKTLAEGMSGIIDTGVTDLHDNKIHLIPLTSYT